MSLCDDYLTVIELGWTSAVDSLPWLDIHTNYVYNNYTSAFHDQTWFQEVAFAIFTLRDIVKNMSKGIGGTYNPVAMIRYLTNCVGGASMDDILTAMTGASFEQLTSFMGITQAYKVAVWDAPFNEEFYAALARGFKTWGT